MALNFFALEATQFPGTLTEYPRDVRDLKYISLMHEQRDARLSQEHAFLVAVFRDISKQFCEPGLLTGHT